VYDSEPLTQEHDLSNFDSGNPELDSWLTDHALHAGSNRTARTFVWAEGNRVVAYYALAGHQVVRDQMPAQVARGGPMYVPAVLLAKLALDRSLQGRGLGAFLLVDALERIVAATEVVAARVTVVDAIDEDAVRFYERFAFRRTAPDSFRLVQKISDIAKALADSE
jgi:GNAT superfamily N-acetyltransferase